MGMFDTIAVSDQLPTNAEMDELGLNKRDWVLQTKDFSRAMDYYVIQNGQFYARKYRVEKWINGDPKGKSVMDRIGHLHREGEYLDPISFTGQFNMYDYRQNVGKWDCWCEWLVTMVNGRVTDVRLHKFEKKDNTERKARDKAFRDKIIANSNKWYNRFFLHIKTYCWFSGRLRWFLYWLASLIQGSRTILLSHMDNTDKKPVDANSKRVFNSAIYRRKIKKMVEKTKLLRGFPLGRKIPKGPATKLKATATDRERMDYAKENNHRLTIDTLHFFADTISIARVKEQAQKEQQTPVEQALAEVAAEKNK